MKFNLIKKNKGVREDTNSEEAEELALTVFETKNFKGRCYNCREFQHKKKNFLQIKK